uniref:ATP synthase complex subunit 8 n=1 Tax=Nebrioporus vagrans TaxID=2201851 RepID=A0A894JXH9_9DYTI|nr:ATP synthase F0 subunit 8 [Nebrioporus vagrans]QRV62780.1 ATP synthase F0 subunit 8 [Nebrioporus vagrans]
MPQMAPMNWIILYMFFSLMFIFFNFMNYYMFMINSKTEKMNKILDKNLSWKW